MRDPASDLAREWLVRSERDLRVTRYLLTMPDPPPESVGFHARQCAEKALKAYLTFCHILFERRHDLNYLIDLCVSLDAEFEQFRAPADELTPYAVEISLSRYAAPGPARTDPSSSRCGGADLCFRSGSAGIRDQ
jgi:HEPN domain-containing protein